MKKKNPTIITPTSFFSVLHLKASGVHSLVLKTLESLGFTTMHSLPEDGGWVSGRSLPDNVMVILEHSISPAVTRGVFRLVRFADGKRIEMEAGEIYDAQFPREGGVEIFAHGTLLKGWEFSCLGIAPETQGKYLALPLTVHIIEPPKPETSGDGSPSEETPPAVSGEATS